MSKLGPGTTEANVTPEPQPRLFSESNGSPGIKGELENVVVIEDDEDNITLTPIKRPLGPLSASDAVTTSHSPIAPHSTPMNLDTTLSAPLGVIRERCRRANKSIHPDYLTVIYMDGKWTDVSCGVCNANASVNRESKALKFYGGIMGLNNHVRTAHVDEVGPTIADTLRTCNRRVVSDEDVALMKEGKEPKVQIVMCVGTVKRPRSIMQRNAQDKSPQNTNGTSANNDYASHVPSSATFGTKCDAVIATPTNNNRAALRASSSPPTSLTEISRENQLKKPGTVYDQFQQIEAKSKKEATALVKKRKFGEGVPSSKAQRYIERLFDDENDEELLST